MATNTKSSFFRKGSDGAATVASDQKRSAPTGGVKRSYTKSDNNDRPKRAYTKSDSTDRPKRAYTKSDSSDRPKRAYNKTEGSDRPKRAYTKSDSNDRPYNSDRPKRAYNKTEGSDRPKRAYTKSDSNDRPYNSDRPKRAYTKSDSTDRPKRAYNKSEGSDRPYNSDRPKRAYNKTEGSDRPKRAYTKSDSNDRPYNSDRPKRAYTKSDSTDRPKRDDKKFDRAPRTGTVPDWVKQTAPRSKAVLHEKKEIAIQEAREERQAVEIERVMRAKRKTEKSEELTQGVQKVVNTDVRLNRFIAQSGVCSRREADNLIEQGLIKVNDEVVTELGVKVNPSKDSIEYEGRQLSGERLVYIIMNKPKGYVTSVEDPHNDLTVMSLLGDKVKERVYPVGRLDKQTTGVLLLTNDGELTRRLTHPSFEQRKIYHAFLDKPCTVEHLDMLAKGIELEDGEIHADEVSFVDGNKKEVGLELHSGRNRIVRRMFEHLEYRVVKLDRVFFAGFTKLGLRRGYWRYLSPKEIITLRNL